MNKTTYIIGHKNPDTDSIASALAYAALKTKLGENVEARRLGTLSEETKFATKYFDIEAPNIMHDARTQLLDLEIDKAELILSTSSCNDAFKRIVKTNNRTLCVVDNLDYPKLKGIVSIGDLSKLRMNSKTKRQNLMKHTNLKILSQDLNGRIRYQTNDFYTSGRVNVITSIDVEYDYKASICIMCTTERKQLFVIENKPSVIILAAGCKASAEVIKAAKENEVSIIETNLSTIEVTRFIYEAVPVSFIMSKNIMTYKETEFTEDVASKVTKTRFRSYPVISEKGYIIGSISRYHLFKYSRKKFILVDHSTRSQSIDYIDKAEITEIIDHHHIGDVQTDKPIYYRNQRCGCTCSIIYEIYKEKNIVPDQKVAGMMLSAIISDTLNFNSETTTQMDKDNAKELADIAGVKLEVYATKLLKASVNLKDAEASDLINRDLKTYKFNKYKVAVGQTNYADIGDIQSRMIEFEDILMHEQVNKSYDLIVMMFTHVLAEGTLFMFYGPLSNVMFEVIERKINEHQGFDNKIMSRKQQLIPKLSEVINSK